MYKCKCFRHITIYGMHWLNGLAYNFPCSPVPTATNIRNTTNVRTLQPSTSSSYAVAIAVGVVVGFVVLLLVVAIAAVVVVILVTKKGMQHFKNCQSLKIQTLSNRVSCNSQVSGVDNVQLFNYVFITNCHMICPIYMVYVLVLCYAFTCTTTRSVSARLFMQSSSIVRMCYNNALQWSLP